MAPLPAHEYKYFLLPMQNVCVATRQDVESGQLAIATVETAQLAMAASTRSSGGHKQDSERA